MDASDSSNDVPWIVSLALSLYYTQPSTRYVTSKYVLGLNEAAHTSIKHQPYAIINEYGDELIIFVRTTNEIARA